MSQEQILNWLKERKGSKFSALEIIKHTGLNKQAVFENLKKLRKNKEVNFEVGLIKTNKLNKSAFIYSYPRFLFRKKTEDSLSSLKQNSTLKSKHIEYFFDAEEHLKGLLEQTNKGRLYINGCIDRECFNQYKRKKHIKELWKKIIEVIKNE